MKFGLSFWGLVGAFFMGLVPCEGAYDVYLIMERNGREVETDPTHGWVSVTGFDVGVANQVNIGSTSGGGGAGRVEGTPMVLSMLGDRSVAEMMNAAAAGDRCSMKLHVVTAGGENRATVMTELSYTNVFFQRVAMAANDGDDAANFEVTFVYEEMKYVQTVLDDQGEGTAVQFGWDFSKNEGTVSGTTSVPGVGSYAGGDDGGGVDPPASTDNDSDGMPNVWEDLYGLNKDSKADAALDADKDGFTNLQEFVAGTDPRKLTSYFRVETGAKAGGMELSWSAVSGRVYRVMASGDPGSGFTQVYTVTAGATGVLRYEPAVGVGPFFKLVVEK